MQRGVLDVASGGSGVLVASASCQYLNLCVAASEFDIHGSQDQPDFADQLRIDIRGRTETKLPGIISSISNAQSVPSDVDGVGGLTREYIVNGGAQDIELGKRAK